MKFQILSHAGLSVAGCGITLICDPWIIGSAYWCAWWNYSSVARDPVNSLKPASSPQQFFGHFEHQPPRVGDIVLLHDKTEHTLAALPALLAQPREHRLEAVTLSELTGT